MSELTAATARDESPVFFPVDGDEVFGILTRPTGEPKGVCAIHSFGKGPSIATVGRGRMSVLLSRRLAAYGIHSFRHEYVGTGDSGGAEWEWSITTPRMVEVDSARTWLRGQGLDQFVLVGTCGGARVALEGGRLDDGVIGVALLLPPLRDSEPWRRYDTLPARHLMKRLLKRRHLAALRDKGRRKMYMSRARSDIVANLPGKLRRGSDDVGDAQRDETYRWIGPGALHGLEDLVARKVPVVMFFGEDDNDYKDWLEAAKGPAAELVERAGDLIRVVTVEGRYYNTPSTVMAPLVASAIAEMVAGRPGAGG